MNYKELEALNKITGRLQAKTLPVEAFLFLLQLKLELDTALLKYKALQAGIYKEYEVARQFDGSVNPEAYEPQVLSVLVGALDALSLQEVKLNIDTQGLSLEDLHLLRASNELTISEAALLYRLLRQDGQPAQ